MQTATPIVAITVDLPDELVALLGSPESAAERVRQSLVLDLLREAEISQGRAARLLGITRWDILDLMARYRIPSGPATAEEMRQEIENARRFSPSLAHARDQRQ
jgi:predicted HTH domain antitoxin